jgi:hypothetical protein
VDISQILDQLRAERSRLDQAIAALEGGARRGTRWKGRRGPHRISAAGRKRLSLLLKRRWAAGKMGRRKKAA